MKKGGESNVRYLQYIYNFFIKNYGKDAVKFLEKKLQYEKIENSHEEIEEFNNGKEVLTNEEKVNMFLRKSKEKKKKKDYKKIILN